MASVREKNGKWYYRITLSSCGKSKYLERGSYPTAKQALDAGLAHELKLKRGSDIFIPTKITYGDMVKEWMTVIAPTIYKDSTINTHRKTLRNYILPVLKNYEVGIITTNDLQAIINSEIPHHTWSGLNKIHATMMKTFDYAVRAGYILRNPLEGVEMPRKRSVKSQELKCTREQETCPRELIRAIFERFPEGHPCHIPLLLGYRCGLRLGEVYALCEEDFDRVNKRLHVHRQIQYNDNNELYFTDLKYCNPGEYRTIDLDADTCKVLSRHISKLEKLRPVMNYKQYYISEEGIVNETEGEPVYFLNVRLTDGSYISPRTMQHVSRVIHGRTSDFKKVDRLWDFHALRHTHASECIAAGMPPESVRRRMGHRHLSTTYKYYVHETEDQSDKARMILEGMYE